MKLDIDFEKIESNLISILENNSLDAEFDRVVTVSDCIKINSKLITFALKLYHKELEEKLTPQEFE